MLHNDEQMAKKTFIELQNKLFTTINQLKAKQNNNQSISSLIKKHNIKDNLESIRENLNNIINDLTRIEDKKRAIQINTAINSILYIYMDFNKQNPKNEFDKIDEIILTHIDELAASITWTGKLEVKIDAFLSRLDSIDDSTLKKQIQDDMKKTNDLLAEISISDNEIDNQIQINFDEILNGIKDDTKNEELYRAAQALNEAQRKLNVSLLAQRKEGSQITQNPVLSEAVPDELINKERFVAINLEFKLINKINNEIKNLLETCEASQKESAKKINTIVKKLPSLIKTKNIPAINKAAEELSKLPRSDNFSKKAGNHIDSLVNNLTTFAEILENPNKKTEIKKSIKTSSSLKNKKTTSKNIKAAKKPNLIKKPDTKDTPEDFNVSYAWWLAESTMKLMHTEGVKKENVSHLIEKIKRSFAYFTTNPPNDNPLLLPALDNALRFYKAFEKYEHVAYFSHHAIIANNNNLDNVIVEIKGKNVEDLPANAGGLSTGFKSTKNDFSIRVTCNTFTTTDNTAENLKFIAVQNKAGDGAQIDFKFSDSDINKLNLPQLFILAAKQVEDFRSLTAPEFKGQTTDYFNTPINILPGTNPKLAGAILEYCKQLEYECSHDKEVKPEIFDFEQMRKIGGKANMNIVKEIFGEKTILTTNKTTVENSSKPGAHK